MNKVQSKLFGVRIGKEKMIQEYFDFYPVFKKQRSWMLFPLKLLAILPFKNISNSAVVISSHPAYLLPFILCKQSNPIILRVFLRKDVLLKQPHL
jgi:hypothetical protein